MDHMEKTIEMLEARQKELNEMMNLFKSMIKIHPEITLYSGAQLREYKARYDEISKVLLTLYKDIDDSVENQHYEIVAI